MDVARSVFISYSGEDQAVGEQVCRLLEEQGIPCWMAPRNVLPGHDYGEQIIDAIESTRVMVLILSEHANSSQFVKREVERAIAKGRVVIPLRVQNVQPSRALELFVSRSQWVDAWAPPMESRVAVLGAAIRGLLGLPPLEESPATPGAGAGAAMGMGTGTGATAGPFMPAAQVPPPPPLAARDDFASRVARLPRSARIAAVIGLVAVLGMGGLMATGGLGGRASASATPTNGGIGGLPGQPTSTTHNTPSGQPPGQPTERATGSGTKMPQVVISAANAAQLGQAAIWDKAQVSGITYSPDGKSIAVAAGAVRVLDAETLETEGELPGGDFSGRPVFAPDWSMLAVYVSDGVELWDTKGAQLKTLTTGKDTHCAAFSPDDKLLATCTGTVVKIWDVASGTDIQTLPEDVMQFRAVAFTPDGKTLIGVGSVVVFWDTSTWKQVHKTSGYGSFEALAVSPDGSLVAAGSSFDGVTVYKVATGLQQRAFSGQTLIVSLAFSPDGSLIASASWDNSVQVLDVASGKVVKTISVHSDRAEAVAFSPDGATLATGSLDSTLRLWRVGP
ncbi:MAG TPA: TIR domain-containing protein [Terriglobales bacterium]|nr:TIR domain-containing protein [Terriglobales bacterium]